MKMKIILLALIILPLCLIADIHLKYDVQPPQIQNSHFENELPINLTPGEPTVPYLPLKILLPQGEKIVNLDIKIKKKSNLLQNIFIDFAREQKPTSIPSSDVTQKNPEIYNSNKEFPVFNYQNLGIQIKNGYRILVLNVYPYKYNPIQKTINWSEEIEVNIETEFDKDIDNYQNKYLLQNEKSIKKISSLIDNKNEIGSYHKNRTENRSILADENEPFQMIIITDAERAPYFADYITWKESQGYVVGVFLVEEIYTAGYSGEDNKALVRELIKDAYVTYSQTAHPLEYVILGGDDEIIPARGCYGAVGNTIDNHIPTDMYYSNLDDTSDSHWDLNGNNIYGEPADNPDMLPEVSLGRITAETQQEFQNFFNKNYYYVDQNTYSNDIAYMFGENLNNDPVTWGGDYKDEVSQYLPDEYHIETLYQRDGNFSPATVIDAFNSGLGIINHMGHSNFNYVFGLNTGNLSQFNNTEYGFAYSQGCYPAAFDEPTSQAAESIAENLIMRNIGLYAFVGNTRYGWYAPGSIWGASEYFDIEFFQCLFQVNDRHLGNALNYSKEQLLNEALSTGVMRWIYYEMVLFGDPSVEVKDPSGVYPYLQPDLIVCDDFLGDSDTIVNPGETVNINVSIENLPDWADAENVTATLSFEDPTIEVLQNICNYGAIAAGEIIGNFTDPFIFSVPEDAEYKDFYYNIEISTPAGNGEFRKTYRNCVAVSLLQKNWPWFTNGVSISSTPILVPNNSRGASIFAFDITANMYGLNYEAEYLPGFPITHDEMIWRSPAFADMNDDGLKDFIFASRTGSIVAYEINGNEILNFDGCVQQLLTPVVADFTGNGEFEIASLGTDRLVYLIDKNGNIIDGFPYEIEDITATEMGAADLNNDGASELLIGTSGGKLYAITGNANSLENFPVQVTGRITSAPTILDNKKIIIGTNENFLHIIQANGTILHSVELEGEIAMSSIVADFDNDDELDIAFTTKNGYSYIMHQNGECFENYPQPLNFNVSNPPLAVDINDDDLVDFIQFSSSNQMVALNSNGIEFPFSPVPVNLSGNTPIATKDIDDDGDLDFVTSSTNGIIIVDVKSNAGTKMPWSEYRGNNRRTGFYGDNEIVLGKNDNSITELKNSLKQNFPNPFNPNTNIQFTLKQPAKVSLNVFNIKGQKIKTLLEGKKTLKADTHTIIWNGKDENGNKVGSGIYLYKMSSKDFTDIRKMILLK